MNTKKPTPPPTMSGTATSSNFAFSHKPWTESRPYTRDVFAGDLKKVARKLDPKK